MQKSSYAYHSDPPPTPPIKGAEGWSQEYQAQIPGKCECYLTRGSGYRLKTLWARWAKVQVGNARMEEEIGRVLSQVKGMMLSQVTDAKTSVVLCHRAASRRWKGPGARLP